MSDKWDVVARIDGEIKGPRILFLTHTDHSKPACPEEAYNPRIIDGKDSGKSVKVITGNGSCSPQGTVAAMLYAGKILAQRKKDLKGSLIIAAVSRDLLANHDGVREVAERGWIDADMAVIGEPSENRSVIGARGINHIAITIQGNPTHRGRPQGGVIPIWAMEQVLKLIKGLMADLPSHPSFGEATLASIDIKCKISPPRTPSSCCLVLDRRTLPGEDTESIIKVIKKRLDKLKLEKQKIDVELIK